MAPNLVKRGCGSNGSRASFRLHQRCVPRYFSIGTFSLVLRRQSLTTCACVGLTAPTFLYCYVGCSVIFIPYFYIRRTSLRLRCICVQTFSSSLRSRTDLLRNQLVTCDGRVLTSRKRWSFCEIFDFEALLTTTIAVVAICIYSNGNALQCVWLHQAFLPSRAP